MTQSTWWRVLTALLLAHAVPAAFILPAEHVHLADADRPSAVAHRHAALHGQDHDLDVDLDNDGVVVPPGEDDDHVAWLPTVFVGQNAFARAVPLATVARVQSTDPIIIWTDTWRPATSARTHGPPRQPPSLRGPPTIPV